MNKDKLEHMLYDEQLDLDQLIKLRENMKEYDFSADDFKYVDEMITDTLDVVDDVEEIKRLRDKYKEYDTSLFDKVIYLKEILDNKDIDDMTKEEIQYVYENCDLSLLDLKRLYKSMQKYDFPKKDCDAVIEEINDKLDGLENGEHLKKYFGIEGVSNKKENNRHVLLGLLAGLFDSSSPSSNDNSDLMPWEKELVNKGEYESNSFEEEELEDDDFYFDDLD